MSVRTPEERLAALVRPEKWYLSAGDGILWAPPFPVWLHAPGFWDEAHVYYSPCAPLFSVALIREDGREVPLRQAGREWRPDRLVSRFETPEGLVLAETKTVESGGRFLSAWSLGEGDATELAGAHLVAFSAQPGEETHDAAAAEGGVRWRRRLRDRREQGLDVIATLRERSGVSRPRCAALRSEASALQPHWRLTPFVERWREGEGVREEVRLEGISEAGLVYAAVDVALRAGRGALAEFELSLVPTEEAHRVPAGRAARPWHDWMGSFPAFACGDAHAERYYDYRLYGLFLNRLEGGAGNVRHPAVAEGIGYFHVPITYSGQCHMFETRWSRDPGVARGTLLNFLDTQKEDGSFHGRIYTNHLIGTDFYHANWGDALLAVDAVHPSDEYLGLVYERLGRYCDWLDRTRDADGTGMYDVVNHFETGQEYMSRYQAVNPRADLDGWKDATRLKAIDATVYVYRLKRALSRVAARQGRADESARWADGAERVGRAIAERMWDPASRFFSDVDPRTMERTGVRAAVCFYPLLTDLVSEEHVAAMLEHLEDPRQFATPWPVPSSSIDDPLFNPDAEWKGKRHVCPWNGRVWPMTNSHVIEGLIRQWRRRDPEAGNADVRARCGTIAGTLLDRFVKLMFHDRDLSRPNCFEHYNPYTGHACEYRGIDDYQHSWVVDLIIRAVCGVDVATEPEPALAVDPVPGPVDGFTLEDAVIRGRRVAVRRSGDRIEVEVDGRRDEGRVGRPLVVPLAGG